MTYVMTDLYGCFRAFMQMLEEIEFSDDDRLIVAGDIIDRGPQNYEMLNWLLNRPDNVVVCMGNHDESFIEYVDLLEQYMQREKDILEAYRIIKENDVGFDCYGTLHKLIEFNHVELEPFVKWRDIMKQFPYCIELGVNDRNYIVVHAGYCLNIPKEQSHVRMEDMYTKARWQALEWGGTKDATIIAGHTPTITTSQPFYNNGKVFRYEKPDMNCVIYNIDCGYVFRGSRPSANMACMRLEDEKVFYLIEEWLISSFVC